MWTNNKFVIATEDSSCYNLPEISVSLDNDLITITQEDGTNEDRTFDVIDMTIEQAMKLKSALEQYLQGK